ncbi:hypothetical protein D9757_004599 [Collybiopsis confluens]|uniref:Proteasome activator PA28 C-terminal domain-containing protein n=1 Tax=Collybiopsis confluens TaxID=2823264 RepID=A0A8H5HS23_9AGAR|nr:hypothetical protein D9757_004599 [Collybiopsis confluens]
MENDLSTQMDQFTSNLWATGEEVVFVIFPKKVGTAFIFELQRLVQSTLNFDSPFNIANSASSDVTVYQSHALEDDNGKDISSKKRKISSDFANNDEIQNSLWRNQTDTQNARSPNLVLENKHIKYLHSVIKKECEELATLIDKVKLWVMLSIPKIQDFELKSYSASGDDFGFKKVLRKHCPPHYLTCPSPEILNELHRAQECAHNLRDGARQSHLARAKICSKLIKYPFIEDYSSALREHDDYQAYSARLHLHDIRNLYATLTDITQKNVVKIRTPDSNSRTGLY